MTSRPTTASIDWHLGDKAATDAAFASAKHVTKMHIVNNRLVPEPDGAARRRRRLRRRAGAVHALHDEPEPACRAARAVGLHRHRARAQAPRHRARRGRRLRLEDLHLRGGDGLRLGGQEGRPAGEVDVRPHRGLPQRRAWPRPRHRRRDGAGRQGQDPRPAGEDQGQSRRLPLDLLVLRADLSLRAAAVGPVRHPRDLRRGRRHLYQHRAGRRLSRGGPAGGHVRDRAHGRGRGARAGPGPGEFRRATSSASSRTRRRSS